jgi:hypothetical protein
VLDPLPVETIRGGSSHVAGSVDNYPRIAYQESELSATIWTPLGGVAPTGTAVATKSATVSTRAIRSFLTGPSFASYDAT